LLCDIAPEKGSQSFLLLAVLLVPLQSLTERLCFIHLASTFCRPSEKLAGDNPRMTYTLAVDMWAFGILLGQMVTVDLHFPYGNSITWENVRNQVRAF